MEKKVVFLFGAGASKGAICVVPEPPSIMPELHDKLLEYDLFYWGSVIRTHEADFKANFEAAYSRFIVGVPPDDQSPRIILPSLTILERQIPLAFYFSRFLLDSSGSDLYSKLMSGLKDCNALQKCLFGSLNYDTLLEQSITRIRASVDYLCTSATNRVQVVKLHGSCNFVTGRLSPQTRASLSAPGTFTNGQIDFLEPSPDLESLLRAKFQGHEPEFLPVMTPISPEKQTYYGATQIQAMRNNWLTAVSAAQLVAVIGVSDNPNDKHVTDTIKQSGARRLLYIGGNTDFHKWVEINPNFRFIAETFEAGFEPLVNDVCHACA